MGHIRKEELHESLINELEELGNIDLSGKQDKTDESLLTESKDLVGAINELFQSANNGKQLIANAIGEPLSSEDTFSAMSNDINGLLATFKTNMMNNGVTVESSDKFKSLIDKIATMVEEGEGKGIQFAEGTVNDSYSFGWGAKNNVRNVPLNLDFTPTYLLVHLSNCSTSGTNGNTGGGNNIVLINGSTSTIGGSTSGDYNLSLFVGNITNTSCDVIITCAGNPYIGANITIHKWYAIGVGEEDTTLRDSLASILQEEGIDVTEEDDMARLIAKVDEEFTKDNNTINDLNTDISNLTNQVNSLNNTISNKDAEINNLVASETTTKTNLATVLTNKGVNVTEEDNIDSLIGKVDEKLDELIIKEESRMTGTLPTYTPITACQQDLGTLSGNTNVQSLVYSYTVNYPEFDSPYSTCRIVLKGQSGGVSCYITIVRDGNVVYKSPGYSADGVGTTSPADLFSWTTNVQHNDVINIYLRSYSWGWITNLRIFYYLI